MTIWDSSSGKVVRTLNARGSEGGVVVWSPDQEKLAYGAGGSVQIWDKHDPDNIQTVIERTGETSAVAWASNSQSLAFARYGAVFVQDLKTGVSRELRREHGDAHDHSAWLICWFPDGRRLASHGDSYVRIWDVASGSLEREIEVTPTKWMCAPMDISADGELIAVCGSDRAIRIFRTATGELLLGYLTLDGGHWIVIAPDGNWMGSEGVESELCYLVETASGIIRLTSAEMRDRHGWQPASESVQDVLERSFSQKPAAKQLHGVKRSH